AETVVRVDADRRPPARAIPAVHVLVDAEVGLDRVDVPSEVVVVRGDAQGRRAPERRVHAEADVAALAAAVDRADGGLAEPLGHAQLGLVRDVAYGPRQGARTEERALRPPEDLDA